jgi:hypothetical protein
MDCRNTKRSLTKGIKVNTKRKLSIIKSSSSVYSQNKRKTRIHTFMVLSAAINSPVYGTDLQRCEMGHTELRRY